METIAEPTLTEGNILTYLSTAGLPVRHQPSKLIVNPNEPRRRLKTRTDEPALQAILDALPIRLLNKIPEKQKQAYVWALETADNFKQLISTIVSTQTDTHEVAINRLLATLDTQHYHRRWICPKCSQRWGRHNPNTLKCPDMNPLSKSEVDDD